MTPITLPAYAKVNLFLDVRGKRSDGYHELVTLFERIDLADEVTLAPIPGDRVEVCCDHPEVPLDGTNLVVRAAEDYRRAAGWPQGIRIRLGKRIPVSGGLGGGSSNAAATLEGLQCLSGGRLSREHVIQIAKRLGADVPFFLAETPWALGTGRGDEIEPLSFPIHLWHLLVAPGFPIPTKAVYEAFTNQGSRPLTGPGPDVRLLYCALTDNHVGKVRDLIFNALEPTVEAIYPAIRHLKATIETKGMLSRPMVSGSGSTVMAVCNSREEAENAAGLLRHEAPEWEVLVAETRI